MSNIAVGSKGKVNANSVNVRTDAGTGYNRVYYAQSGDIVVVQARKTGTDGNLWYKITNETHYTTSVGYIRNDFVDAYASGGGGSTSNINVGDTVITILPGVNFRSTPGGTSLFQVSTGTSMVVTAITVSGGYNWYKGVLSSKTGYLRGDCVEKSSGSGGGLTAGHYVKMNQSNSLPVNVRASTSTGSKLLGKLQRVH
ncbi:MAG: SH3 domain-containing protein [Clostridia bacterium]